MIGDSFKVSLKEISLCAVYLFSNRSAFVNSIPFVCPIYACGLSGGFVSTDNIVDLPLSGDILIVVPGNIIQHLFLQLL